MDGASIACQLAGRPGGAASGLSGGLRFANEYSFVSAPDKPPVAGSIRLIFIPAQKLPKLNHGLPDFSATRLGSIALKSSSAFDRKTRPRSTQRKPGPVGSSVLFVTTAIPEVFLPNSENA